ncbi:uncharacterized protein LOC109947332 [Prunus persica]|uniref:uncharacterized protein LOC109947332 n=1 Tax=Prunus persica TaxID=3760 RepID=UPI0009AB5162|nr:uncharacterized protein LOC109947332 [Prunus persica]
MSNLTKLEFVALDISGKNYLTWILDAEIHLNTKDLGNTIKEGNEASLQDRSKAMIFLCHHLIEGLKSEYLGVKDPAILWKNLEERYVGEKIHNFSCIKHAPAIAILRKWIYKIFPTELLMKNHHSHLTGSKPFPEANANASFPEANASNHGHGSGRSYGRGRGRGHYNFQNRGGHNNASNKRSAPYHQKWNINEEKQGKGKEKETNFTDFDNIFYDFTEPLDITHLEVSDFFAESSGTFDDSYGDGNTNVGDENMKDGDDDANDGNPNID